MGKIQIDDKGTTNFLDFEPGIIIAKSISINDRIWFYPGLTIFFPQSSEDELYSKWEGEVNFHFLYPYTQRLDFVFGSTYLASLIRGAGGTSVQGNGNSTSTYYVPEKSKFIGGFAPEVGLRYEFWRAKYINIGLIGHQIFKSNSRSFTVSIGIMSWI